MRDTYCRAELIDILTAGAAAAEYINPEIFLVYLDVNIFDFRKYGYRGCRCMYTS